VLTISITKDVQYQEKRKSRKQSANDDVFASNIVDYPNIKTPTSGNKKCFVHIPHELSISSSEGAPDAEEENLSLLEEIKQMEETLEVELGAEEIVEKENIEIERKLSIANGSPIKTELSVESTVEAVEVKAVESVLEESLPVDAVIEVPLDSTIDTPETMLIKTAVSDDGSVEALTFEQKAEDKTQLAENIEPAEENEELKPISPKSKKSKGKKKRKWLCCGLSKVRE